MSKALWRGAITNLILSFSKYTERNRNDYVQSVQDNIPSIQGVELDLNQPRNAR